MSDVEPVQAQVPERLPDERPFGLSDEDFWSDPLKNSESVSEVLMDARETQLVISGPKFAYLDVHKTIPIVCRMALTLEQRQLLRTPHFAILVASRLADGETYMAPLCDPAAAGPLSNGPWLPQPRGLVIETYTVDMIQRLRMPFVAGEYECRVVLREHVSNAIQVCIRERPAAYEDPEVAAFLAAGKPPPLPRPIFPLEGPSPGVVPNYRPTQQTPAVSLDHGVVLDLPRVLVLRPETPWLVHGAFRLPLVASDVFPPLPPEETTHTDADGDSWIEDWPSDPILESVDEVEAVVAAAEAAPAAVAPVVLILTGPEDPRPTIVRLRVPVWADESDPLAETFTGQFAIDLRRFVPGLPTAQTWFVYAMSRQTWCGPTLSAIVSPEMLANNGR